MFATASTRPHRVHFKKGGHVARTPRTRRQPAPRSMSLGEAMALGLGCDGYKFHRSPIK